MRSFTSNFKVELRLAWLIAREAGGGIVAAACLLGALGAWRKAYPKPITSTLETVVVETQRQRSHRIPAVDTLLLGDSSVLMDIAPAQLSKELSQSVESLATIGFMGPRGYAKLLENYLDAGNRPATLLVLMHATSLAVTESIIQEGRYERSVLDDGPRAEGNWFVEGRRELFNIWIDPICSLPLPGSYGKFYGWSDRIAEAINSNHGGMTDPHASDPQAIAQIPVQVSPAVRSRLPFLRAALARAKGAQVFVGVTPSPEQDAFSSEDHARLTHDLAQSLSDDAIVLDALPARLPGRYFASTAHLTPEGRQLFTSLLSSAITRSTR